MTVMTEPIHARLDREVKRMTDDHVDGVNTHISESYINGVEHAAHIAYRMADQFRSVEQVTAALVKAWPTEDRGTADFVLRNALKLVATDLGVDLDAALAGRAEAVTEVSGT